MHSTIVLFISYFRSRMLYESCYSFYGCTAKFRSSLFFDCNKVRFTFSTAWLTISDCDIASLAVPRLEIVFNVPLQRLTARCKLLPKIVTRLVIVNFISWLLQLAHNWFSNLRYSYDIFGSPFSPHLRHAHIISHFALSGLNDKFQFRAPRSSSVNLFFDYCPRFLAISLN